MQDRDDMRPKRLEIALDLEARPAIEAIAWTLTFASMGAGNSKEFASATADDCVRQLRERFVVPEHGDGSKT